MYPFLPLVTALLMPSIIGPYDGRKARRKRCDTCIKRQIRCHGGIPCGNCRQTNRLCGVTTKHTDVSLVFVRQFSNDETKENIIFPLRQSICPKGTDRYLSYFFTSFLPMNVFTSNAIPMRNDLLALSKSSPALRDAIDAVAAMHVKRQGQSFSTEQNRNVEALQAYARSVRCVQEKLATNTFMDDQAALWITFFLGLFEQMRDSTGTNWLSHFLHGTSTMLCLQKPETLNYPGFHNAQRRSFFLTTRIFEISRSLIFSSSSFLSKSDWTAAFAKLWEGESVAFWHPKEALFDILPHVSELNINALNFCEDAPRLSLDTRRTLSESLGNEGLVLQAFLQQWWVDAVVWGKAAQHGVAPFPGQNGPGTEFLIAHI
ncbi:hypothetical protein P153DRAFT_397926 [Dothidotthia symphoricarpi CBS 119687]|uniref:Zn(2)-C6 fungal-type domain-containing protein n=1 Tax=Dothidotthia symphoricarpi CBS 119687 TaxID=1392245 RepID=A0A6A6AB09_9PLEO|nr:uncharacterized protein P153DRAFT_397926 [Dothidotthia symphoricarpi CBS 119687]KAF2128047.1 hypothetical protein P153DRAFT_397926 [Dothidotthia symphoricarpi CBS 119687]